MPPSQCDGSSVESRVQAALQLAARGLLSEETVRCAVAIINVLRLGNTRSRFTCKGSSMRHSAAVPLQLRHVPLDKGARQQLRSMWTVLIEQHFKEGAPYPVSIKERSVLFESEWA
jgi:hypothetical protein